MSETVQLKRLMIYPEMDKRIASMAQREGRSRSNMYRRLLQEALNARGELKDVGDRLTNQILRDQRQRQAMGRRL